MTESTPAESLRIGDLVEVPDIKTVIQLKDLEDPNLREMILDTFVLTEEVSGNLRSIFSAMRTRQGRGIFLKGHFGSGKSHFLSMLSMLLRYPKSWRTIIDQALGLLEFKEDLSSLRFLVVDISLVRHRSSEFLEDVFLRSIFLALRQQAGKEAKGADDRSETFQEIKNILDDAGFSGMVLLVDELSEFLKSKPDARSYNEDVRFLQYLGEEARSFPFWIIASLQEWIEETGEIHQDTFNKIKDRYRIRLNLGRSHLEELISERLIRHREGADVRIGTIFDELKTYFPSFPATRERFIQLYPVHPATSVLLDRLKPLFSEHRGVVDFIHHRLKGDPERHIGSLMDRPAQNLLTPEKIFDHFLDRILERSETQVYVERVYHFYEAAVPELFQDQDQQRIAMVLVKLLILFSISPVHYEFTSAHLAEMVLFEVTPLDSAINYQFVNDILDRFEKEGSYVRVKPGKDITHNHYYLDLKADIAGLLRQRIRHLALEIFPDDTRLFTKLGKLVDSPYLPLSGWLEQGGERVTTIWQHTRRSGNIYLGPLNDISIADLENTADQWDTNEDDFVVFVGTTRDHEKQLSHVKDYLLPLAKEKYPGLFLFWIPSAMGGDPRKAKEMLAALLLQERMNRAPSSRAGEERDFLRTFLDRHRPEMVDQFVQCYYDGYLLWDGEQVDLSRFGKLTQEKFLAEFARPLLERRFPKHNRVRPLMDSFVPAMLKDTLLDFLYSGTLLVEDRSKFGLRNVLEGLLKPMGLIRKKGNRYELHIHPAQNELAREFFTYMGDRKTIPLEDVYWYFRKGEYGLLMPQFEILVLSLLFSGHLVAYVTKNRRSPEELKRKGIKGITALGKGEVLDEGLQRSLPQQPLIPKKYYGQPLTPASQEEIWTELKNRKAEALEDLKGFKSRVIWAASLQAFKRFPWEKLINDIHCLIAQWDTVKVSLSSREGLERVIRAGVDEPELTKRLDRIEDGKGFVKGTERALFIYQYLTDSKLRIPDGLGYQDMREERSAILSFYENSPSSVSGDLLDVVFARFQEFQESYIRAYVEAHHGAAGGEQFDPYEKLRQSSGYSLLKRLSQLEMVSVEHDFRSIDQQITSILVHKCRLSPRDRLLLRPVCNCNYRLGENRSFKSLKKIQEEIDLGIRETFEAVKSPAILEKIIPYRDGLGSVGKVDEADAIRRFLDLSPHREGFLEMAGRMLTPGIIHAINEAFRGKVVVVKKDLDALYRSLIHRKYTFSKTRKIISRWLEAEDIEDDTFVHFLGSGRIEPGERTQDLFREFIDSSPDYGASLYRELGHSEMSSAMIASFWASQYGVSAANLIELFPFLNRGGNENELIGAVSDLCASLLSKKPSLFDSLVSQFETDPAIIQTLWSLIPSESPEKIFQKETVLPGILKQAFERLLDSPGHIETPGSLLPPHTRVSTASPSFQEKKSLMEETLATCASFQSKAVALKRPVDMHDSNFHRWESLYLEKMAFLPSLTARLRAGLDLIGAPFPQSLKNEEKEAQKRLVDLNAAFGHFYRERLADTQIDNGNRPLMIRDIPFLSKQKRGVPNHDKVRYVLMDGMRWDLWQTIKEDFFGKTRQYFRFVREGTAWAHLPTNTPTQLVLFEESLKTLDPHHSLEENLLKVSGMDERIHTEKGGLTHLFANIVRYLEIDLLFRLKEMPSGTLLILFADHGFVENPLFNDMDKYHSSRYTHGGDSPFEVIVPWAWVMRV